MVLIGQYGFFCHFFLAISSILTLIIIITHFDIFINIEHTNQSSQMKHTQ